MIERYLSRLADELALEGVRGRAAARVLAEARDHLVELETEHGSRGAIARFGKSRVLARAVAEQLATTWTRRATYGAFAALAVTGVGYLGVFAAVGLGGGWPDIFGGENEVLGGFAVLGMFLFPQVAFVCGCLAVLRALRLWRRPLLPAGELRVMRSRAAVALAAGGLTSASLALFAVEFRNAAPLAGWVPGTVLAIVAAGLLPLGAGAAALTRSAQPRAAVAAGAPGDVFEDLALVFRFGPLRALPAHPWRFAVLFAGAVSVFAFVMGWVNEGDPGSGLVRGAFEGLAVLGCFGLLGRRLALGR